MKIKNVLSLFDGMSCGQIALNKLGTKYENYFASEIDKHAIGVTQYNYTNTVQLGDVKNIKIDDLPKIDLLIGGSPCTNLSLAGNKTGMITTENVDVVTYEQYIELKESGFEFKGQSYLFWEYIRLLKELKSKYFLLENVRMSKKWKDIFSEALGIEPIEINSSKFVPQSRYRLYWTNIPNIGIPTQVDYNVNDFIYGDGFPASCNVDRYFKRKKIFNTLTATYYKGIRGSGRPSVSTEEGLLDDNRDLHRMLTPNECEKIQGVPLDYTKFLNINNVKSIVSNSQRYKMLGNGWTVDVIAHIFKNL